MMALVQRSSLQKEVFISIFPQLSFATPYGFVEDHQTDDQQRDSRGHRYHPSGLQHRFLSDMELEGRTGKNAIAAAVGDTDHHPVVAAFDQPHGPVWSAAIAPVPEPHR